MAYDEELNRMAMAPEDPYVSAIDLGDDIACWLAKRPVTARPTTASRDRVADPAIWSGQKKVVTVRPMPGSISMRSVTKGEIFSAAPTQGRPRTPGGGTRPGSPHISRGSGYTAVKRRSLRDRPEGTESPKKTRKIQKTLPSIEDGRKRSREARWALVGPDTFCRLIVRFSVFRRCHHVRRDQVSREEASLRHHKAGGTDCAGHPVRLRSP